MNAKMGPIAHYLGGAFANQTKTFVIRWPDEGGSHHHPNAHAHKTGLAIEIIEKPGSRANHKNVKAS